MVEQQISNLFVRVRFPLPAQRHLLVAPLIMKRKIKSKILRFQEKSGWCGPAVIQMVLAGAGIKKSQSSIARSTYLSWWGTTHDTIFAYLTGYFKNIDFKIDSNLYDIDKHLMQKHTIVVNWWDNMDEPKNEADGHYSLIIGSDKNTLTFADPSEGRGIWKFTRKEFIKRWYDYLDIDKKKKISRWLLWVDPKSLKLNDIEPFKKRNPKSI